jgi:signal transduction histidine kinase
MWQIQGLPFKLHAVTLLTLVLGVVVAAQVEMFSWPFAHRTLFLLLLAWGLLTSFEARLEYRVQDYRFTLGPAGICLAQVFLGTPAAMIVATASALADTLLNDNGRVERELGQATRPYAAVFHVSNAWIATAVGGTAYDFLYHQLDALPRVAVYLVATVAWAIAFLLPLTVIEMAGHSAARDYPLRRSWLQSIKRWAPSCISAVILSLCSLALFDTFGRTRAISYVGFLLIVYFAHRFYIEKDLAARQFELALAGARDGVAILEEHRIVYANDAFAELLDRPLEKVIGTDYGRYLAPHSLGWSDIEALREAGTAELELRRQDDTLVRVEVSTSPVLYHGRECLQLVARDVTARHALHLQAAESQKLRALGQMASGVAHDFNNGLMAIVGNLSVAQAVLSRPNPSSEALKMAADRLKMAEQSAMDAASTVRRLQIYSRPAPDVIETVELVDLCREVRLILRPLWYDRAQSEGRDILVEVSGEPPVPVEASPSELREAFTNLVTNAIHALPHGGVIRLQAMVEAGEAVVIVSDNGVGMPQELVDHIFEPFFTTKGKLGSGLGLFVTAGIVNHHGGRIEVKSVEGEGTTFTLHFPLAAEQAERETSVLPPIPPDLKVLIVEDDPSVRYATSGMLESAGVAVEAASDGATALEALSAGSYNLVITDRSMPGMTGMELARTVHAQYPRIPIIMITGWLGQTQEDEVEEPNDLIAARLHKPIQMPALLGAIHTAMLSVPPEEPLEAEAAVAE